MPVVFAQALVSFKKYMPPPLRHRTLDKSAPSLTNRHFGKILMYFLHLVKPNQIPTDTCFIQKIYALSSSLLQGKHLPFTLSPLRLNIIRLFVILSLTQLYRYTPKIFLFSTATFKYKYRAPLRRIGQDYSTKVAFSIFQSMKWIVTSGPF